MTEIMFSADCVSICLCVHSKLVNQTVNANSSKTVKAMDFKFNERVSKDFPGVISKYFLNGAWPGSRNYRNF